MYAKPNVRVFNTQSATVRITVNYDHNSTAIKCAMAVNVELISIAGTNRKTAMLRFFLV